MPNLVKNAKPSALDPGKYMSQITKCYVEVLTSDNESRSLFSVDSNTANINLTSKLFPEFTSPFGNDFLTRYVKVVGAEQEFLPWPLLEVILVRGELQINKYTLASSQLVKHELLNIPITTSKLIFTPGRPIALDERLPLNHPIDDQARSLLQSHSFNHLLVYLFDETINSYTFSMKLDVSIWKTNVRSSLKPDSALLLFNESTGSFDSQIYFSRQEAEEQKHARENFDDDLAWNCVYAFAEGQVTAIHVPLLIRLKYKSVQKATTASLVSVNSSLIAPRPDFRIQPFIESFCHPLTDPGTQVVFRIRKQIKLCHGLYQNSKFLAAITCLVQCSGSGKSKEAESVTHEGPGFYVCLRGKGHGGYPSETNISKMFMELFTANDINDDNSDLNSCTLRKSLTRRVLLLIGRCVFSYLLDIINALAVKISAEQAPSHDKVDKLLKIELAKYAQQFEKSESIKLVTNQYYANFILSFFSSSGADEKQTKFSNKPRDVGGVSSINDDRVAAKKKDNHDPEVDVLLNCISQINVSQISTVIESMLADPIKCFVFNGIPTQMNEALNVACDAIKRSLQECPFVFVIDEVGLLAGMEKTIVLGEKDESFHCNGYQALLRALSYLHESTNMFFLGLGTNTSVETFTSPIQDQSFRARTRHQLFKPIVLHSNFDIWRKEFPLKRLVVDYEMLLDPILFKFLCSQGHPLFSSVPFNDIVAFACRKILNGTANTTQQFHIAVWMIRTGMNGRIKNVLASSLVTNHMATLLKLPVNGSHYQIVYRSCPALALGARFLSNSTEYTARPFSALCRKLREYSDQIDIDRGQMTEHFAAFLLLKAIDKSKNFAKSYDYSNPDRSPSVNNPVNQVAAEVVNDGENVDASNDEIMIDAVVESQSIDSILEARNSMDAEAMKSSTAFDPVDSSMSNVDEKPSIKGETCSNVIGNNTASVDSVSSPASVSVDHSVHFVPSVNPSLATGVKESKKTAKASRKLFNKLFYKKEYLLEGERSQATPITQFPFYQVTTVREFLLKLLGEEKFKRYCAAFPKDVLEALINVSHLVPIERTYAYKSQSAGDTADCVERKKNETPLANAYVAADKSRNLMTWMLLKNGMARQCGYLMPPGYYGFDICLPFCFKECDSSGRPIFGWIAVQVKSGIPTSLNEFAKMDARLHYVQCSRSHLPHPRCSHCQSEEVLKKIFNNQVALAMELKDLEPLLTGKRFVPTSRLSTHSCVFPTELLSVGTDHDDRDDKLTEKEKVEQEKNRIEELKRSRAAFLLKTLYPSDPATFSTIQQACSRSSVKVSDGEIVFPKPLAKHEWRAFRDAVLVRYIWNDALLQDLSVIVKTEETDDDDADTEVETDSVQKQKQKKPKNRKKVNYPINLPEIMQQSSLTVVVMYGWEGYFEKDDVDGKEAIPLAKEIIDQANRVDVVAMRDGEDQDIVQFVEDLGVAYGPGLFEFDAELISDSETEADFEQHDSTGRKRVKIE